MNGNELRARCAACGTELKQGDKQCPKCNSTRKSYEEKASVKIGESVSGKVSHKRKGKGTLLKAFLNRRKPSGDPKLKDGVREDLTVDRGRDEYHQVVKDARTGKVTPQEHQRLSEHNKQDKNRKGISQKLGKWVVGAIIIVGLALIGNFIWFFIVPHLQQPLSPNIISSTNPNPIINRNYPLDKR